MSAIIAPRVEAQVTGWDAKCRPTQFADPTGDPRASGRPHPTPPVRDQACVIRAHMFLLAQHLDVLKDSIDDVRQAGRSKALLQRMQALLATLQATEPYKAVAGVTSEQKAAILAGYRQCLDRTQAALGRAETSIAGQDHDGARRHLERADQIHHDCHVRYAFPKYPGR